MKQCNTCNQDKPLNQFGRDNQRPDGRMNRCRVCRNARLRSQYTGSTNKKRAKDRRLYAERSKEKVKSDRIYLRKYNQEQRAKITDTYIKKVLAKSSGGVLASRDIPPTLIELKRAEIQIHQLIKDKSND